MRSPLFGSVFHLSELLSSIDTSPIPVDVTGMVISPPFESTIYSYWATDIAGMSRFAHDINRIVKAKITMVCIFIILFFYIDAILMTIVSS